ncbi:MAG: hypothetical protein HYV15_04465, partial [Elusimicrobia bacterium]|nr:hypothetical protein [Elusimicrobiota bacterium]
MSPRTFTLLGANALFAAVSAGLFFAPGWETVLYPAYAAVFLWADLRKDEEMHIIFVFLATAAAFLLMTTVLALHVYDSTLRGGTDWIGLALSLTLGLATAW